MMSVTANSRPSTKSIKIIPFQPDSSVVAFDLQALVVKDNTGYEIIPFDEIIRIMAGGNYSQVFRIDGRQHMTCQTLKLIGSKLPNDRFLRIHQSHIISIQHIRRVDSEHGITLSDNSQVAFSRRSKSRIFSRLNLK